MKKYIFLLGVILIIIVGGIFFRKTNYPKVHYIEEKLLVDREPTFKFIGYSKHFSLATGEAYYDGNYKALYLTNFKLEKEIKNLKSYSLNIKFNNKLLISNEKVLQREKDIKNFLNNINLSSYGEDNIYERDAFMETTEDTFKSSIKISIEYCLNNNKCKEEVFNIAYIKDSSNY